MKKVGSIFMWVLFMIIVVTHTGCGKNEEVIANNWKEIIYADFFTNENEIEKILEEEVHVKVTQSEEQLNVTIESPDICDELLNWMESITDEEFDENALEAEIIRLLKKTNKMEKVYLLNYTQEGDIVYTSEFSNSMMCGLNQFYSEMLNRIQKEMGGEK